MTFEDLWITAHHESGHAVSGLTLGLPVLNASTRPADDGTSGRVSYGHITDDRQTLFIVSVCCGPAAEMKASGKAATLHHSDRDKVRAFFEAQIEAEQKRKQFICFGLETRIKHMVERSERLVNEHWSWIQHVAGALITERDLSAAQIRELRYSATKKVLAFR